MTWPRFELSVRKRSHRDQISEEAARKTAQQAQAQAQASAERVVEVVVAYDEAPLLIGQRVLVKFMKPGETAGARRAPVTGVGPDQAMKTAA